MLAPALEGIAAEYGEREAFLIHFEQALSAIGYLGRDTAEVIMRRLRRIFGRAHLTHDEVKLFRGMARQTLWAAERAGLEIPAPRRGVSCEAAIPFSQALECVPGWNHLSRRVPTLTQRAALPVVGSGSAGSRGRSREML